MKKLRDPLARLCPQTAVAVVALALSLVPGTGQGQITSGQANQIRAGIEDRIEALTILGGDFGLASGIFRSRSNLQPGGASTNLQSDVTKGGGDGDVGDPRPLGDLDIGWQPRLQGNMGGWSGCSRAIAAKLRQMRLSSAAEHGFG
jgi:hypothetical protein